MPNVDTQNILNSFLGTKFSNNRRASLGSLVEHSRSGKTLSKGMLVVMASGDRKLRLKILDQDTPHKGFSEPLALNAFATEHKVTPNYLLWYLSHEPVASYLLEQANGAVFIRVPRKVLHALPVPLPTRVTKIKPMVEFSVTKTDNQFSMLIANLHNDYLLNTSNKRYRTAAILAGAICEVILYQLLVEQGVSQSLLKNDRTLGFNKLLDYIRILKLEQTPGFPMSQLAEIQKIRNAAVHAGLLINSGRDIAVGDLDCFNPVIKYFGL